MFGILRAIFWFIARTILGLRYRVTVKGLEEITKLQGPLLVMPNHPAFVDPPIVLSSLTALRLRPLLFEGNFKGPLAVLMPLLNAIRVPDMATASAEARQRVEQAIDNVKEALRTGSNVILWPAGALQRAGEEKLGAARTAVDVINAVPECKVILVHTEGLWGSRFGWAFSGKSPPFFNLLIQTVWLLLGNLLFFMPRRKVTLTLEYIPREKLPLNAQGKVEREVLNPWIEKYHNPNGPDTPVFVPLHFAFGQRSHEFPPLGTGEEIDLSKVRDETKTAVNEIVAGFTKGKFDADKITPNMTLEQLGIDSLDGQAMSLQVEKRFGFRGEEVPKNMAQVYALAAGLATRTPPKPPAPSWFVPAKTDHCEILGESIPEAFIHRALACRADVVVADDNSGTLTYERLLVGAVLMAEQFRQIPEKNVGLLLPAAVGCDVALLGMYLADKLPVVLNWTTGKANLEHAATLMNLKTVVTSKAFIDRAGVEVPGTQYLFLEEVGKSISTMAKLLTLLKVRYLPGSIRGLIPKVDIDTPAVVLFTSGSEKAPKAVPLTHRNMIANQRAGITALKVTRKDSILGFLPAFHSFGMSVTGLFPILAGMRVVRHPDPTDAARLARKAGGYKPNILVGTPTFVSYIVDRAEPDELKTLRMVIVGAEKCPQALFDRLKQTSPNAVVVEGYGITECSPVVAVNPPDATKPGTVGKPLDGVEIRVMEVDTEKPLNVGEKILGRNERGMLLVTGPTIFPGYLGEGTESPFCEFDGKRWYVTGDLVFVDDQGYIHFSGRLKRFLKVGGEMVSLPALEEPFTKQYPPTKDGPRVAVEAAEIEDGRGKIVLFTTEELSLRSANELLEQAGFHGVMRLDEVRRIEKVPTLGTGKTDYKVLKKLIA
jgi:long-chain-fatty-acid--[acyl-carrier-protein] ligase